MKRKFLIKKFFIIIFIVVYSYILCGLCITEIVLNNVFSRYDQISVYEKDYINEIILNDYKNDIIFNSGENKLKGHYFSKENNKGIIIISGGLHSNSYTHYPEISYFLNNGFNVFSYDNTGVNESTGNKLGSINQMVLDLKNAVYFVSNSYKNFPISIYGHSCGGYSAIAVLNEVDNINAVVSISGFNSSEDLMLGYGLKYAGKSSYLGLPAMKIYDYFDCMNKNLNFNYNLTDIINNTDTKIMIIEGSNDEVIDKEMFISNSDLKKKNNLIIKKIHEKYRNMHSTIWLSKESAKNRINNYNNGNCNEIDENFLKELVLFYYIK